MRNRDLGVAVRSFCLLALGAAAGCLGRSEASVRSEFNAYVKGASACTQALECALAGTDCPLGCYVAVRADRKADVEAKSRQLVAEYQQGGHACYYDCATPGPPLCVEGRCAVGAYEAPGAGGAAGGGGGQAGNAGQGGAAGPSGGGGPIPNGVVTIVPGDGTTAAQGMALQLQVSDPGHVVDATALAALGAAVLLETWPEGEPVAAATTAGAGGAGGTVIEVTPGASLGDRWYALVVKPVPSIFRTASLLPDGTVGVRFRPTSQPRVRLVQICEKASPGSKLIVAFSEPVTYTVPTAGIVGLSVDGAAAGCEVYAEARDALSLACAALSSTSRATVSVGAGVTGAGDVPLSPVSFDIDVGALPPSSCRAFVPPIP